MNTFLNVIIENNMSISDGTVRCKGCDFVGVMQYRPITLRYHLHTGQKADSHRIIGWCFHCDGIRDIESKLDENLLQEKLELLQVHQNRFGVNLKNSFNRLLGKSPSSAENEIENLNNLLLLANSRKSLPRCLSCSDTSTALLDFNEAGISVDFQHSCGSHLYLEDYNSDETGFFYSNEIISLDSEGRFIQN